MSNAHYNSLNPQDKPAWLVLTRYVPAEAAAPIVPDGTSVYVLKPAAGLNALSVKFPSKPMDNQMLTITSTQSITSLTLVANSGQTISGSPTAALLAANTAMTWVWSSVDSTWYRVG